jgi:hypothetical protein
LGVQLTNIGGATITIQIQGTNDASVSTSTQMWTPIPATQQQNNAVTTPTLSGYGITSSSIYTFQVSCVLRFVRIFISNYTSGIISGTAYLRTAPSVLGGSITPAINVLQIASSTPNMIAGTSTSPSSGIATSGGIPTSGGYVPTVNPTNANSTLATTVPNPLGIGGREQPYVGALSGIFRYVTVDGGGRYILGGDVASTATPFQSTKADGSVPSIPPRGIGGIPNNSQGSQSLTTSDTSQVEGDTNTMLLKQILIELKINNQQLIEFAKSINTGNITLSDPQEYRDDSTFQ